MIAPTDTPLLRERPSLLRQHLARLGRSPATYTPNFRAEEIDEFIAISDGDLPIALLDRETLYLEMREFYPDGRAKPSFCMRRPKHNPSVLGVTLVCHWRLDGQQRVCSEAPRITFSGGGATLTISIDEEFGADEAGYHLLTFYFDNELGCYAVDNLAEVHLLDPHALEVSNLWARGVGDAWPEDTDLRYTLWSNTRGGLTWFPHNPLTPNTPGNMDADGRRAIPIGGFLGFGVRPQSNPVLETLGSNTEALSFATCSCFYDEHFNMACPAPLDAEGKYRWAAHYRLVSLPDAAVEALRAEAEMLDFGCTPAAYDDPAYLNALRAAGRQVQPLDISVPFELGKVNDCETPIDPRRELIGHYWYFIPQPYGNITWDQTCGHSGTASIRVTGRDPRADLISQPCGPSIRCQEGRGYRFTALVKTALAPGAEAWLELSPFLYASSEVTVPNCSLRLSGSTEWTRLEVAIPPSPGKDYLALALRLRGEGTAWFDDIMLMPE
ncbi:MAG TPA: hypothetical protein VGM23_10610 [Armatimonadota bacterium]